MRAFTKHSVARESNRGRVDLGAEGGRVEERRSRGRKVIYERRRNLKIRKSSRDGERLNV